MRPVPILDGDVWESGERHTIGPPSDVPFTGPIHCVDVVYDTTPVEVVGGTADAPRLSVKMTLDEGELEQLARTGTFWISFLGPQMVPFEASVNSPARSEV